MNVQEIANQLVQMCREGKGTDAVRELYADHACSVEMKGWPTEIVNGKEQIFAKHERFFSGVEEMHDSQVSDPMVADNHFACVMTFDATFKGQGRMKMVELCVFEVNSGKIVKEQFFYSPMGG